MARRKLSRSQRATIDSALLVYLAETRRDSRKEPVPTPRVPISETRLVYSREREAVAFDRFGSGTATEEDDAIIQQRLGDYERAC